MKGSTVLVLLSVFHFNSHAIYLTNTSSVRKIQKNPAVWTEDEGIWGPLIEKWAIGNMSRVMMLPPAQNSYVAEDKDDNNIDAKESKISPGKIISTSSTNNQKPPGRQVSETDLYLLGAIEKLVYKVDFMEKRLRRVEEMLYYAVAGNRIDTGE
ncbi:hypothetical protein NQ314_010854 [Rhamnusium bicolor]|uniref:Uncharacterized protein n=1 Tax=Rhamnusium bicolor TaxID=1586634 RepID=A0AAV8XLX0_9CUCU|nr:hypothetical protein NQ314_010854 [Rhamnusium bicolor]